MGTKLELPFSGTSNNRPDVPGFQVIDGIAGIAVDGLSTGSTLLPGGPGPVFSIGVRGTSQAVDLGIPTAPGVPPQFLVSIGVLGSSPNGTGVRAEGKNGVFGQASNGTGVEGQGNVGVAGDGDTGVVGTGRRNGVVGQTNSDTDAGVNGRSNGTGFGVFGLSERGHGVEGHSTTGIGVVGFSQQGLAGRFIGNVEVTGVVTANDILVGGMDCAEDFDMAGLETIEAGTVMVIDKGGALLPCDHAYDRKVMGVISGAGAFKTGIVLGRQHSTSRRLPLALVGRVYCKVDAEYGPVEIGDLLTTSVTLGHAMKAGDPFKAFGAVIGKALSPLMQGRGLVPIIVALQ